MKIINTIRERNRRYAIDFEEQDDSFSDDTLRMMQEYESKRDDNLEVYDATANDIPVVEIDEATGYQLAEDFIPDTSFLGEGEELRRLEEEPLIETREEVEVDEVDESVAEATEIDERVPDFASAQEAVQYAAEENRVMEIFYVTKGRGSRDEGRYLKRERGLPKDEGGGVNIHRIVEPHYIYQAKMDGKNIVVTYDRSVRRIRSFIIDNIYDYNLTKNRKTKEDQYFRPRMRVMPSSGKGIKTMKNVNDKLTKIASTLDEKGLKASSLVVKDAIKVVADYKMAQYVGIQGYWLKNRRCWDNCYRHKRTTQPGTPAQEVWMECWDEYNDSINADDSKWEKYAGTNEKVDKKAEKKWNKIFASKVEKRVKEGFSQPEAIYDVIDAESKQYVSKIIEASADLMTLADTFSKNGQEEISKQLSETAMEMLKEAGPIWEGVKNIGRGLLNPMESLKNWGAKKGKLLKQLEEFSNNASTLAQRLRQQVRYQKTPRAAVDNKRRIIEAKDPRNDPKRYRKSPLNPKPKTTSPTVPNAPTAPTASPTVSGPALAADTTPPSPTGESFTAPSPQSAPEAAPSPEVTTPAADPQAATQSQTNLIQEAYQLATAADQLSAWIGANVPMGNPRVKDIAQTANFNLSQGAKDIRSYLSQQSNINYVGIAEKLEAMAQGATMAMQTLYQEQGTDSGALAGAPAGAPTGAPAGAPAGAGELPGADQSLAPGGVTASDVADKIKRDPQGAALIEDIRGNKITQPDLSTLLKIFKQYGVAFDSDSWPEFSRAIVS